MNLQHKLHTSLAELLLAAQAGNTVSINTSAPHAVECRHSGAQEAGCQGVPCAIHTVTSWVAGTATASTSSPAPQKHLLMLVSALSYTSHPSSEDTAPALANSYQALTEAAVQLCSAASASAAYLASMHAASSSRHSPANLAAAAAAAGHPLSSSSQQGLQQRQGQPDAAVGTEEAAEQFRCLLFWSCHLTTALQKFVSSAQATSTPLAGRRKTAAQSPTTSSPARPTHCLPPQLQQRWAHKSLPACLQHLLTCYQQLVGAAGSSSTSSTPAATLSCSQAGTGTAAAVAGWQQPTAGILHCSLPVSTKQQSSMDLLLYGTCLAILNPTTSSASITPQPSKTRAGSKSGRPPAKHARKAAPPDNSTSGPTVSLTPKCSELLASCVGCHLLFRHQQQLAGISGSKQPGGSSSSSSSSWVWCEKAAHMLADPQQQHLHPLLTPALMSLLHNPSTRTAACTMLCTAADSISGAAAVGDAARQPGKHAASAGIAAAAAVVNSQSSMLLLDLLAGLLTSHWPAEWVCQAPTTPQAAEASTAQPEDNGSTAVASLPSCRLAAAANSAQHQPAQDAAAAAAVLALPPDALRQLLAASLLPRLQPLATLCKAAAARKHWLSIPATAAASPPPCPSTTAATGVRGSVLPSTSAAVECAAARGQAAGLLALAAAAVSDRDATVRAKALTLLQQAAPHLLQAWHPFSRMQHQTPPLQQQQQQQAGAGGAGAPFSEVLSGLRTAAAAVVTAICSQLLGSSKASRLKALLLLQQLLQPVSAAPGRAEQIQDVQKLQQQLVLVTFPAVCNILAAGDDSPLCCSNCKTAAAELLPAMAAVLQPQQALQLSLSHCSSTVSGTVSSTVSTQHEQRQTPNRQQDPAALLLAPLAQCSAQQLYELLQQQQQQLPPEGSTADATAPGMAEDTPASHPTAHSSSSQRPELPPAARRPVLAQLQQLVGGLQSAKQGLRQHAFIQACQALAGAADAATDGNTTLGHQLVLLQGMQLLQVCGGCSGRSAGDMRAELAILVDAADLCCSRLAVEGSAPAAAAAAHVVTAGGPSSSAGQLSLQQQQQDTQSAGKPIRTCEVSTPVCHELLRTIVCILGWALSTAATAAAADDKLGVALPAAAAAVGHDVWCSQWMWGEVGACLMHHLEAVVSYSSSNSSMGGESARLPVSTLDKYLEVLCKANRHQQLLLHELLATWHKQLAKDPPAGAAAAAARGYECKDTASAAAASAAAAAADSAANARLVAFLLLLKHLSGFYALEQASFKQRVVTAMTAASKGLPADGGSTAAAIADTDKQQQQQGFDYMCGEEEAACVDASTAQFTADLLEETAPACYLPLLLQLVGARGAPTHVKVLALQALEPLLLVSPDLSSRHSSTLAVLLTDPSAPPALLLQAVSTTGAIISRRPAESSVLVGHLEQLLLAALTASSLGAFTSSGSSSGSNGGGSSIAGAGGSSSGSNGGSNGNAGGGGGSRSGSGDSNMQEAGAAAGRQPAAAVGAQVGAGWQGNTAPAPAAAVAAARCYCRLLLSEKLLLTGHSWGVVAQGLLATGALQGVATSMQHLVAALTQQQRMPRCKVALDLVLNFSTPVQAATATAAAAVQSGGTTSVRATASGGGTPASSSTVQQEAAGAQAEALVHQLLRLVLTPKELSAESLMLPLLQAVAMAASSGWTGAKSSSSSRQWGSVAQGSTAAAAAAALLAAGTPSGRCLEVLLRTCQAHKHSMALHCSSSVVSHLTTFVRSYGSSSSSAPSRAQQSAAAKEPEVDSTSRKAAGAQHAAMQQQLLRLLQGMSASAAADVGAHQPQQDAVFGDAPLSAAAPATAATGGTAGTAAAAAGTAAAEAASDGEGDWEQPPSGRTQGKKGRILRGAAAAKPNRGAAAGGSATVTGARQLAGDRAAADAVGLVTVTGVKRRSGGSKSSSSVLDAQALQQLLRERQQDVVQLKALGTS